MPTKFTKEAQEAVISKLKRGYGVTRAAEAAGVTARSVRNWVNRGQVDVDAGDDESEYAQFYKAVAKERSETLGDIEDYVKKAARQDWRAGAWILERQLPDEYGDKTKLIIETETKVAADMFDHLERKLPPEAYELVLAAFNPASSGDQDTIAPAVH